MEMVFIMHGESQHSVLLPEGYGMRDPDLTGRGREQAQELRRCVEPGAGDAVVAGPVLRMLQTAVLWSGEGECVRYAHPMAGPRQHPVQYDFRTHPCDLPMEPDQIRMLYPDWQLPAGLPEYLWLQGIHTLPRLLFAQHAERFLQWCQALDCRRVFVVTDAGCLAAYRAYFAERAVGGGGRILSEPESSCCLAVSV